MKTPPNSKDEGTDRESEDVCLVVIEGIRFGEFQLKETVREFTIQEGRRVKFTKNDNARMRVTYKVKGCPWVVLYQGIMKILTFINGHTCPKKDKNRAAIGNWVTRKLVKKVRKYPNFRHCDIATYFKKTYQHHINLIPGQTFWEIDTDEVKGGRKKFKHTSTKNNTNLKRQLAPFTCSFYGKKVHTRRGCKEKKLVDVAAVEAEAAAEKISGTKLNVVEDAPNAAKPDPNAELDPNAADNTNVVEDALIDSTNTNVQGSKQLKLSFLN
ncbi:hypothetical protein Ahy_A09g045111 [Arachis hypogaea]|uniref:Uncharacterized protein n=1 Tax=Arachis hypogaea TaxID=3818 RepID=A0A445BLL6_ARAHY|nr:hypothetical protein Ahy_A09g045111 [Arachis hypogaea]